MGFFYKVVQFIVLVVFTLVSLMLSFHFFGFIAANTYIYFLETLYQNYLAGLIALAVFLLGILSLLPYFLRSEPRNTIVRDGATGSIRVSLDAVEGLIYRFVSRQSGVKEVKTYLKPVDGGLLIRLKIGVCPHQDIPDLVTDIQESLKDYVSQVVGVKVEKIETVVHSIENEEERTFKPKKREPEPEKEEQPEEEKPPEEKPEEDAPVEETEKDKRRQEDAMEEEIDKKWAEEEIQEEEIQEEEPEKRNQDKDF